MRASDWHAELTLTARLRFSTHSRALAFDCAAPLRIRFPRETILSHVVEARVEELGSRRTCLRKEGGGRGGLCIYKSDIIELVTESAQAKVNIEGFAALHRRRLAYRTLG